MEDPTVRAHLEHRIHCSSKQNLGVQESDPLLEMSHNSTTINTADTILAILPKTFTIITTIVTII